MSRAILEFTLPDDETEYRLASNGASFALVCTDLDEQLRSWLKYGHGFKDADEALQATRDFLYATLDNRNVSTDMVQ